MPVVKRLVEPIHCSRAPIPKGVKNDLEAVVINTLSSVILQLSSVAKHAEDIFAEIFIEANRIHQRTCSVQQRLDQLAIKTTKLDSAEEEISLQEINNKKAFKMTLHSDQQVLSRQTLPPAMMESYSWCQPVPNLHLLTKFRHDGKDAMKFYTDPSYFFELWKQKMVVEFEKRKREKRQQRGKKRDLEKKVVKGLKKKDVGKNIPDWEIQNQKVSAAAYSEHSPVQVDEAASPARKGSAANTNLSPRALSVKRGSNSSVIGRPTAAPPPPPPGSPAKQPPPPPSIPEQHVQTCVKPVSIPPPPPPPIPSAQAPPPPPPPVFGDSVHAEPSVAPPPPPPPPAIGEMPSSAPPPPPPPTAPSLNSSIIQSVVLSSPKPAPAPVSDPRNDLLTAIRDGMNLRKTQQITKEEKKHVGMGNDVASILSRRVALEFSDSGEDSDYSDAGEWSDD